MSKFSSTVRAQWLIGTSVGALILATSAAADAQDNGLGRRSPNPAAQAAAAAARQAQQSTAQTAATQRARAAFEQAAQRRRTMDAAQVAARAAAQAAQTGVPNGLGVGGLDRAPNAATDPSLWIGASAPTQSVGANGRTSVVIDQTDANAFLNWQTFNVGRETDLTFNQAIDGSWTVVNRVTDPLANPTQILGTIKAPGTVLVMNRNGIIFGGASQVNVGSLLAAAGTRANSQFQAYGIYSNQTGGTQLPAFDQLLGKVEVQAGAQLTTGAPTSVLKSGGYVMLFGGDVTNAGAIVTPKGQTLLAAGDSVALRQGVNTDGNAFSTTRGAEAAVTLTTTSPRGTTVNTGSILAREGDVTLVGRKLTQGGVAIASTTVNNRGTIHLLTSSADTLSSVTFTADSYTAVLPELDSTETALDAQRDALIASSAVQNAARNNTGTNPNSVFNNHLTRIDDRLDLSRIEVVSGGDVNFAGGSIAQAQGGIIAVEATRALNIESGATLDVSGVRGVALDIGSNAIKVNIQGFELRDSPLNRDNEGRPLYNQNVWVDARDLVLVPQGTGGFGSDRWYTPGGLIEASGYLGNTGHTIGEWLSVGGTITLRGASVTTQQGSVINLMGGSLNYAGGLVRQSLLQGVDGKLYTADNAPADMKFVSVGESFNRVHDRWGEAYTETYQTIFSRSTVTRQEDGYLVGRDGGKLLLEAPKADINGTIDAEVVYGVSQTVARPTGTVADPYKLGQRQAPLAGSLTATRSYIRQQYTYQGFLNPLTVSNEARPVAVTTGLWINSNVINAAGLGGLALGTNAALAVADGITLGNGGALTLNSGATLQISGDLVARGGSISLGSATLGAVPIVLADGQRIDTRGVWTNALLDPDGVGTAAFMNGGAISIFGALDLRAGSAIDASAGGAVFADGTMRGGNGGDVTLFSTGEVRLDGTISSFGFGSGGRFSLSTPTALTIGGTGLATNGILGVNETVPYDVRLAQPLTIAANTPLPVAFNTTLTTAAGGTLIPAGARFHASGGPITVGSNGWVVPAGVTASRSGSPIQSWTAGMTVPAGTTITSFSGQALATNYRLPQNSFTAPLQLLNAVINLPAGGTWADPLNLPVNAVIPAGTRLSQAAAIMRTFELSPDSVSRGFSSYNFNASAGVVVQPGAQLAVTRPVLQFNADSASIASGADPLSAASIVLPPLFSENSRTGRITQRGGADISFGDPSLRTLTQQATISSIQIGKGAAISVDPGRSIALASVGQITVEGALAARGGTITIVNLADANSSALPTNSIWIGEEARIDVSGLAYTARDVNGNRYGLVTHGGTVNLGSLNLPDFVFTGLKSAWAHVVVRPGAIVDASGTSATFDVGAGRSGQAGSDPARSQLFASNGGTISLSSWASITVDDAPLAGGGYAPALRAAAGGAGASGGTLAVTMEMPGYNSAFTLPPAISAGRVVLVSDAYTPSAIGATTRPGMADPALVVGQARISADQIESGGFGSLTLNARAGIVFDGNVSLDLQRQITLQQGVFYNTSVTGEVTLRAPYVMLDGRTALRYIDPNNGIAATYPPLLTAYPLGKSILFDAQLIDVRNMVFGNYTDMTLRSTGDLRMLTATGAPAENFFPSNLTSFLANRNNLSIVAAQVYPATGVIAVLGAGAQLNATSITYSAPGSVLSIASPGGATPALPYSVFGSLTLNGATILQGGVLRAPFGAIALTGGTGGVRLLDGSITSASANGLVMPYGGTTDGLTYRVNGGTLQTVSVISGNNAAVVRTGVTIASSSLTVDSGALIDVSGGGTLLGAAFIAGRGGSVDTLLNPRLPGGQVYAIVPGAGVAPVTGGYTETWTGATPTIGQQVTIPDGVPGLPAGTYTLMPANYALLPGAFRVELGARLTGLSDADDAAILPSGSYAVNGYQGVADTGIRDPFATRLLITPGATVRTYSQYNEQSYASFLAANAAQFGVLRPMIEADGKFLSLQLQSAAGAATNSALDFRGKVNFAAAKDGLDGVLTVMSRGTTTLVVTAPGSATTNTATQTTISSAQIDAIGARVLYVGGGPGGIGANNSVSFGGSPLIVESGVKLTASQIGLLGGARLVVGDNVELNTLGRGFNTIDSRTGMLFGQGFADNSAALFVSNGVIELNAPVGGTADGTAIEIGAGAKFYSEGTVAFNSMAGAQFRGDVNIGTRNIILGLTGVNIGSDETLAGIPNLPAGLALDQAFLDRLFAGDKAIGAPALERLVISARSAINFFGTIDLNTIDPATGKSRLAEFVFNAPAIYGYGSASDTVRITTGSFVWNGNAIVTQLNSSAGQVSTPVTPPARITGLGNSGSFLVEADKVVFGYGLNTKPLDYVVADRLMLGFEGVTFRAGDRITATNRGSVAVFASGPTLGAAYNPATYAGVGGALNLITPLVTSEGGAAIDFYTGALRLTTPQGAAPSTASSKELGGALNFNAGTIELDTAVVLPSGMLTLAATGNVSLSARSRIDLSGQTIRFDEDVERYSWGGDLIVSSRDGNVTQLTGGVIDVSAANSDGGSVTVSALGTGGLVSLAGTLRGAGGTGALGGMIDLRAQRIGEVAALSTDFAALNTRLNAAGFSQSRGFQLKQGNLTVGNEVVARNVAIALDGGSLTVSGKIDASGVKAGSIRLAARDDLVLTQAAVLDLHGTAMDLDSYGQAIEATNRSGIELTSGAGWVRIGSGATMDLTSPDAVARGRIEINVRRTAETTGDVRIDAAGPLTIKGAGSVAVNAFWTYAPTDAAGTIVQSTTAPNVPAGAVIVDRIDAANQTFHANALANAGLQTRLGGLAGLGAAYHFRPGVEITSSAGSAGKLTIAGDIDLAGYRYGPQAVRNRALATFGAGEPLALVIRAADNLAINGSVTDGFAAPLATPDDNNWRLVGTVYRDFRTVLPGTLTGSPTAASTILFGGAASTAVLDFAVQVRTGTQLRRNQTIPFEFAVTAAFAVPPQFATTGGWTTTAPIYNAAGQQIFAAGDKVNVTLPVNTRFGAGSFIPQQQAGFDGQINIGVTTFPRGTPLSVLQQTATLNANAVVPAGVILPAGLTVVGDIPTRVAGTTGKQGQIYAIAPMLAPGMLSASIRLAGGADLGGADQRAVQVRSVLGSGGNITMADYHQRVETNAGFNSVITSVIRTGTGDLDLVAGNSISQDSQFGIYTAGQQTLLASGNDAFNAPRVSLPVAALQPLLTAQRMYYPDHGGNLLISASGDVSLYSIDGISGPTAENIENWQLRQGAPELGQPTGWGINFGNYAQNPASNAANSVLGFVGVGTLGGGNVSLVAGRNAGNLAPVFRAGTSNGGVGTALRVVAASSGRVTSVTTDAGVVTGGTIAPLGGGDVDIRIGGRINGTFDTANSGNVAQPGYFTAMRGDLNVEAQSIGGTIPLYSFRPSGNQAADPRAAEPYAASGANANFGSVTLYLGDASATLRARGDVSLGGTGNPTAQMTGASALTNYRTNYLPGVRHPTTGALTDLREWFSLWTPDTSLNIMAAGGRLGVGSAGAVLGGTFLPPQTDLVAASSDIHFGVSGGNSAFTVTTYPAPDAQLDVLARGSIYGNNVAISPSAVPTGVNEFPNPFKPAWITGFGYNTRQTITVFDGTFAQIDPTFSIFAFLPTTPTGYIHANDFEPSHVIARDGDIVTLPLGLAEFGRVKAGRDIVGLSGGSFLNHRPGDVTEIVAGRDMIYGTASIAGPGALVVTAGEDMYFADKGSFTSTGPIGLGDRSLGADVTLIAGATGMNYDALKIYLDNRNLAEPNRPLADQAGKVARVYGGELSLAQWLRDTFGYAGDEAGAQAFLTGKAREVGRDLAGEYRTAGNRYLVNWLRGAYDYAGGEAGALAYFNAELSPVQQQVFLRGVYFSELTLSGREYTDPDNYRFGSYLRGRAAIAALFPDKDAAGKAIARNGNIVMFGGSGARTNFGGNVQVLAPGGQVTVGVLGTQPPASSGLVTQGNGDVQVYSKGSLLLGLSRVMTTFGGDIAVWSAEGDINAGRGAKTTIIFTPPRRTYDLYGGALLAPQVPSSGAGIATLDPIPEVAPGDVDLIAPLGTVDAGEAGIRVSGNINVAALRVVNAANIEVKGKATGIPTIVAVDTGALTSASNAASAVSAEAERLAERARPRPVPRVMPSIVTGRLVGFGEGDE